MELPQKFLNLLVIIIPLGLFIVAFFVLWLIQLYLAEYVYPNVP